MILGMVEEVELKIMDTQSPHWSPAQIAGFLKERGTPISFGTITDTSGQVGREES